MPIDKIPFTSVTAIMGKPWKMSYFHSSFYPKYQGKKAYWDVTDEYRNNYCDGDGMMANAAHRGDTVHLYILGDDVDKLNKKVPGWETLADVVGNADGGIDFKNRKVKDVVKIMMNKK